MAYHNLQDLQNTTGTRVQRCYRYMTPRWIREWEHGCSCELPCVTMTESPYVARMPARAAAALAGMLHVRTAQSISHTIYVSCYVFAALQQADKFSGVSLHIRRHLRSTHSSGGSTWIACRHCDRITVLCGPQLDVYWMINYFSCLSICQRLGQLLPPKSSGQQQHTLLLKAPPSRAANQIKTT